MWKTIPGASCQFSLLFRGVPHRCAPPPPAKLAPTREMHRVWGLRRTHPGQGQATLLLAGVPTEGIHHTKGRDPMNRRSTTHRTDFDLIPIEGNPRQLRVVRHPEAQEPDLWEDVWLPAHAQRAAVTAHVQGTYTDRAKAFSISTWQLSTVTGVGAWLLAGLEGTALFSLAGLVWLLGGYFAVWLLSFALHTFVSPEGAELFRAAGEYRLLRQEQKERHRRLRALRGE